MQALIAEFDEDSNNRIEELWNEVAMSCGKDAKITFRYPHFTWQGAENYDVIEFEKALRSELSHQSAFKINLAGLGVFTGEMPILYLNMVKTPLVCHHHQKIHLISLSFVSGLDAYWLPENWMPHLTLVEPGTDPKMINKFLPCLLERKFDWQIEVQSIALHSDESGSWERLFTIDLLEFER